MLKLIMSRPEWILPLFSPRTSRGFRNEESVACITRDICLRLFRHDSAWLEGESRKGTLFAFEGDIIQTVKWQAQYDNPVRRRIRLSVHLGLSAVRSGRSTVRQLNDSLRKTFACGGYAKLGFKERWKRWTHIPRRYRSTLRRAYPFYFTLRDLVKTAERLHQQRQEAERAEIAAATAVAASRMQLRAERQRSRKRKLSATAEEPRPAQRWSDGVVIRMPSVDLADLYRAELLQPTVDGDQAFFASFSRL